MAAVGELQRAIDLRPADASYYNLLGNAYAALHLWEDADYAYSEAIRITQGQIEKGNNELHKRDYRKYRRNRGLMRQAAGDYASAGEDLEAVLADDATVGDCLLSAAICHLRSGGGDLGAAEKFSRQVMQNPRRNGQLAPDLYFSARELLAEVMAKKGQWVECVSELQTLMGALGPEEQGRILAEFVEVCDKAVESGPNKIEFWLWRGQVASLGGRHDVAVKSFERAKELGNGSHKEALLGYSTARGDSYFSQAVGSAEPNKELVIKSIEQWESALKRARDDDRVGKATLHNRLGSAYSILKQPALSRTAQGSSETRAT